MVGRVVRSRMENMTDEDWDIIEVSEETLAMLDTLAIGDETYNDIINRIIITRANRRG